MERKKELIVSTPKHSVQNRYTVEYPTVGQMIDIESMKLVLSKGKYTEMILSGTKWMSRALNHIDMIAYFSILCPKLLIDLKVDFRQLSVEDSHDLVTVYQEQFLPWWNDYERVLAQKESGTSDEVEESSSEQIGTNDTGGIK